jgi:tetratricopeptide (TPR) repeat protein
MQSAFVRVLKRTNVRFLAWTLTIAAGVVPLFAAQNLSDTELRAVARQGGDAAMQEGAALVAGGKWEEARRAFERAVAWNPDLAAAHFNLGVALGVLGRRDDALAAYRRALRLAPAMSEALVNIGVELFKSERWTEALASLERAVAIAPSNPWAHHNLGVVLASVGRLDDAIAALSRAAALAPEDHATRHALADTHYNIGVRHARRREWTAALASYQRAIEFDSLLPEAFNGAGIAYRRLYGDHAATAMFAEAVRLRPHFVDARYNLASSLAALGRYEDAIESCRAALRLHPTLRPAVQLLDSLQRLYAPGRRTVES